jgi:hypothetical protein
VPICKIPPPWGFLLSASRNSQQSYGLPRLSHASNLRKEISALIDQWMEANNSAMLARWLMEQREWETTLVELAAADASASDNLLIDFAAGRTHITDELRKTSSSRADPWRKLLRAHHLLPP